MSPPVPDGPQRRTVAELLADARAGLERLEPAEAYAAMANGALIVDTRCGEALTARGAIPGARHVPLSVLYWRVDPTSGHDDPELSGGGRRLILLCADGYSSSIAAATLRQLGLRDATDVVGGFTAWAAAGLPVITPRDPAPAG